MTKSSPFTARWVLENTHLIPAALIEEYNLRTKRNALQEAEAAYDAQYRRVGIGKHMRVLCIAVIILFAVAAFNLTSSAGPMQTLWLIVLALSFVGAFGSGIAAAQLLLIEHPLYRQFERSGFGGHLKQLCSYISQEPAQLKYVNLLQLATIAIDVRAREFVIAEKELQLGFRGRLQRQQWKFDPKWNEKRDALGRCYDSMEPFGLVEPVDNPRDAWKPYIKRAEQQLIDEESGAMA